jgi:hypothetical protein
MGTPIIPSFEPTQDDLFGAKGFDRTISPTVEISRYQDDGSKVQTQRSHNPCSGLDWSRTHGENNKQVRIGKISGFGLLLLGTIAFDAESSGPSK